MKKEQIYSVGGSGTTLERAPEAMLSQGARPRALPAHRRCGGWREAQQGGCGENGGRVEEFHDGKIGELKQTGLIHDVHGLELNGRKSIWQRSDDRRRRRRIIACRSCAKAKSKCDKLVPSCSRCLARGIVCEIRTSIVPRARRTGERLSNCYDPASFIPENQNGAGPRPDNGSRGAGSNSAPHHLSQATLSIGSERTSSSLSTLSDASSNSSCTASSPPSIDWSYLDSISVAPLSGQFDTPFLSSQPQSQVSLAATSSTPSLSLQPHHQDFVPPPPPPPLLPHLLPLDLPLELPTFSNHPTYSAYASPPDLTFPVSSSRQFPTEFSPPNLQLSLDLPLELFF